MKQLEIQKSQNQSEEKHAKRPLMPFFFRRVLETIAIILVSSLPIYLLAKTGFIPNDTPQFFKIVYVTLFTLSAVIYLWLSTDALRIYLVAVGDAKTYFITNITILILQGLFCIVGLKWFDPELYTAFFGFTKPLRMFGIGKVKSAAIFWMVHAAQIAIIPTIRLFVKKELDKMEELVRRKNEERNKQQIR